MIDHYVLFVLFFGYLLVSEGKMYVCELEEDEDISEPLHLTPYLDCNKIEKARIVSEVKPFMGNIKSYSGYITVDKEHQSHMFFWYFKAESFPEAPVILWLQGGPGSSSLVGLFTEHGPYTFRKGKLNLRLYNWSKVFHMIYVDNPVGSGFSYTQESGMCQNETCVGKDLYSFVTQFFKMFPKLKWNDFYIFGQSYGCKYVAAVSIKIHAENASNRDNINLKGIGIGNGLCDPLNMIDTGNYLYQLGLIDDNQKQRYDEITNEIMKRITDEKWSDAFELAYSLISTDPSSPSFFQNATGFASCFNVLESDYDPSDDDWQNFIADESIRRIIHVGNRHLNKFTVVFQSLKEDVMQSVSPWISELADNYKVLLYSGQLDILIPYTSTVNFVKKLQWAGSNQYKTVERQIWKDSCGNIAGYIKNIYPENTTGSLTEVLVRNAGHLVPIDQPRWALEMVTNFIYGLPPFKN